MVILLNIYLLIKSNIYKSIKTSVAFFLLMSITIMIFYTSNQITYGLNWLYKQKKIETNSADFAAVLPYNFFEKYQNEILEFKNINNISLFETTEALLLKNTEINVENKDKIYGSFVFRNADRNENLSKFNLVESLEKIPDNAIYIPYVCKTFFNFNLGDYLEFNFKNKNEKYIIAGFTEDVLFGNRSNIIFDLPSSNFFKLKEKVEKDEIAIIISMNTMDKFQQLQNKFSEFIGSKTDDELSFYLSSDIEYSKISRSNNINIYIVIMNIASIIGMISSLSIIWFHMKNTFDQNLKEFGTLKAIGYKGKEIAISYIFQFIILTLLSILFGVILSKLFINIIIENIVTDIGFAWKNPPIHFKMLLDIVIILFVVILVSFILTQDIIKLKPIEAFRENFNLLDYKKNLITIEKSKFPLNLSITLKMIDSSRKKSILISIIVSIIMIISGFVIILYINLVLNKEGILKITGTEVYSVNVQINKNENIDKIINEINEVKNVKLMKAIEQGSSKLLCDDNIYASLCVYSDYEALENPSLYNGRYPKHNNEIAISSKLSKILKKQIGDTIQVSNVFQENSTKEKFIIVGLTQGTYTGGLDIYLTMEGLLKIDFLANWQSIHIYLDKNVDIKEYCFNLKEHFSNRLIYVGEFEQVFYSQLSPIINSVKSVVIFIMVLVFFIISIMVFFVTNSILLTQKRSYGIMKALGYSTKDIIFQIIMTFIIYIGIGCFIGGSLLFFSSNIIISILFSGMGIYKISFSFPIYGIIILFICMEFVGCLVAYVSALKVRKILPYNLINY